MPYTHTFEIMVNGVNMQGELSCDGADAAKFKTDTYLEMSFNEISRIISLFQDVISVYRTCGAIEKIEIVKKP